MDEKMPPCEAVRCHKDADRAYCDRHFEDSLEEAREEGREEIRKTITTTT